MYRAGQSLIHGLDPRIKLLSCLTLVVLTFAAGAWVQLAVLMVVTAAALRVISEHAWLALRVCLTLRWLLLFTLLMHLLLSPGRTIGGVGWLSLDGLILGSFVCLQMALAAALTAILAITTSIDDLAAAFGWCVQPLAWLGCRTDDWQKIVSLALGFIPVVHAEVTVAGPGETGTAPARGRDAKGRWSVFRARAEDFTERMLTRGDQMACRIASDECASPGPAGLPSIRPLATLDRYCVFAMLLLIFCYWLAG